MLGAWRPVGLIRFPCWEAFVTQSQRSNVQVWKEDKAWESQELAQSHVDKPELKPAAKPIQDPGPFRLAQCPISELQLNLTRTGTKVYGIQDTEKSIADYKPDDPWW